MDQHGDACEFVCVYEEGAFSLLVWNGMDWNQEPPGTIYISILYE